MEEEKIRKTKEKNGKKSRLTLSNLLLIIFGIVLGIAVVAFTIYDTYLKIFNG